MQLISKRKFDRLTPAKKRVAIVKDVLARMEMDKIKPTHGYLWQGKGSADYYEDGKWIVADSPQNLINNTSCSVCAKGAILTTWIGNFNKVSFSDCHDFSEELIYKEAMPEELLDVFPREMLDNIEAAFEGCVYPWHYNATDTEKYQIAFRGYNLKGIMEYIIANGGEFPLPE